MIDIDTFSPQRSGVVALVWPICIISDLRPPGMAGGPLPISSDRDL